jgi:hypothetical protein
LVVNFSVEPYFAEVLRRALLSYMNAVAGPLNAYPAYWGPFSVIREGAR